MSWDTVIALNRQLDVVENLLLSPAPLDEFWRTREEYLELRFSNMMAHPQLDSPSMGENTPAALCDAPGKMRGLIGKRESSHDNGAIVERLANAVARLQQRQHESKVSRLRYVGGFCTHIRAPNHT